MIIDGKASPSPFSISSHVRVEKVKVNFKLHAYCIYVYIYIKIIVILIIVVPLPRINIATNTSFDGEENKRRGRSGYEVPFRGIPASPAHAAALTHSRQDRFVSTSNLSAPRPLVTRTSWAHNNSRYIDGAHRVTSPNRGSLNAADIGLFFERTRPTSEQVARSRYIEIDISTRIHFPFFNSNDKKDWRFFSIYFELKLKMYKVKFVESNNFFSISLISQVLQMLELDK